MMNLNLAICASYNTVQAIEEKKVCLEDLKQDVATGLRIGAIHGLPMLASVLAMKALVSTQSMDFGSAAILSGCALQFLAPAAVLAYFKTRFHKRTSNMLWASLFMGGISNGVIFSYFLS